MGMYTELIFGAKLDSNTPKEVINQLRYMINNDLPDGEAIEEVFKYDRNPFIGSSAYFPGTLSKMWQDDITNDWHVLTRGNIKNGGDIENFLEWIKPYIRSGSGRRDMYAIVLYEEDNEPTIYYKYED